MLKVDEIQNGVVIDHITAGTGLALYHMMELEKLHNASVALLQNVRSQRTEKGHNKDRGRCQRDEL